MRALTLALVLVALAAPAAAQDDPLAIQLTLTPIEDPVYPGGFGISTVNATMSCALLVNAVPPTPATLRFVVPTSPLWSETVVEPASVPLTHESCKGGSVHVLAQLLVGVASDAPAFVSEPVVVNASLTGPAGTYHGSATQSVEADYVGDLEASANATSAKVAPGGTATFRVTVKNLGNAKANVEATWSNPPTGWRLTEIEPALLGSAPHGDNETTTEFVVAITAPAVEGAVKETKTLSLMIKATREGAAEGLPATASLGFTVTSERIVETPTQKGIPGPATALAALAVAGAAAFVRTRRA